MVYSAALLKVTHLCNRHWEAISSIIPELLLQPDLKTKVPSESGFYRQRIESSSRCKSCSKLPPPPPLLLNPFPRSQTLPTDTYHQHSVERWTWEMRGTSVSMEMQGWGPSSHSLHRGSSPLLKLRSSVRTECAGSKRH